MSDADLDALARLAAAAAEHLATYDAPGANCTGITATWCPACGNCTCGPLHKSAHLDAAERSFCDDGCPLHSKTSVHADDGTVAADALRNAAPDLARDLVAAVDALRAERDRRDALAAAVLRERAARTAREAALHAERLARVTAEGDDGAAWQAVHDRYTAARVAHERATADVTELLAGAAPDVVRAGVVRAYLDAADAMLRGPALWDHADAERAHDGARTALAAALAAATTTPCRSDYDGDCRWDRCPQRLDGEPWVTGRRCPLAKET